MTAGNNALRIDAHHHLWRYTAEEFDWLEGELSALQRDFLEVEFQGELQSANVAAAVVVQARQTIQETDWLLSLADATFALVGVVGWLPISDERFPAMLQRYLDKTNLKGLRHVVQAEAAGFLDGDAFNRGIRTLLGTGLVYDLLIQQHQLAEAIRFVDRHPAQQFVLDHLAKPGIQAGETQPWATHLRELARRSNVVCKVSGMVTEAGGGWTPAQLRPYFDTALDAFGPERMMVGSDWPVLTAHCSYAAWWQLVQQWVQPLAADDQAAILGGTASRIYRLALPTDSGQQFTTVPGSM